MKLISFFHDENGMTLVEILIVLIITSVIVLTVIPVLNVSSNSSQSDITVVEDIQQARRALKRITSEINYADLNNQININPDLTNPGSSILVYNNDIGNNCNIFLNGGVILFQQAALAPVPITNQNTIQTLQFAFNAVDADNRTIDITIALRNGTTVRSTARQLNRRINL